MPVHAKESITIKSNQMGIEDLNRRWNKSVSIYGALGKNKSHDTIINKISILFFLIFELIIAILVKTPWNESKKKISVYCIKKVNLRKIHWAKE